MQLAEKNCFAQMYANCIRKLNAKYTGEIYVGKMCVECIWKIYVKYVEMYYDCIEEKCVKCIGKFMLSVYGKCMLSD